MIYYKFRAAQNFSKIVFEGSHIECGELKALILQENKLVGDELVVENEQTGDIYPVRSQIPKNTRVIVKRVPAASQTAFQQQQQQHSTARPAPTPTPTVSKPLDEFGGKVAFSAPITSGEPVSEEKRLEDMMRMQSEEWKAPTYERGQLQYRRGGVPHPNYRCHRCNQGGHFIKDCPTNGDPSFDVKGRRGITGIPTAFLKQVDAETAGKRGLLLPDGTVAMMVPNEAAFERDKRKGAFSNIVASRGELPDAYKCSICKDVMKEAVMIACCGNSFCDDCVRPYLMKNMHTCPVCHKSDVSPDTLRPNVAVRASIEALISQPSTQPANPSATAPAAPSDPSPSAIPTPPATEATGNQLTPSGGEAVNKNEEPPLHEKVPQSTGNGMEKGPGPERSPSPRSTSGAPQEPAESRAPRPPAGPTGGPPPYGRGRGQGFRGRGRGGYGYGFPARPPPMGMGMPPHPPVLDEYGYPVYPPPGPEGWYPGYPGYPEIWEPGWGPPEIYGYGYGGPPPAYPPMRGGFHGRGAPRDGGDMYDGRRARGGSPSHYRRSRSRSRERERERHRTGERKRPRSRSRERARREPSREDRIDSRERHRDRGKESRADSREKSKKDPGSKREKATAREDSDSTRKREKRRRRDSKDGDKKGHHSKRSHDKRTSDSKDTEGIAIDEEMPDPPEPNGTGDHSEHSELEVEREIARDKPVEKDADGDMDVLYEDIDEDMYPAHADTGMSATEGPVPARDRDRDGDAEMPTHTEDHHVDERKRRSVDHVDRKGPSGSESRESSSKAMKRERGDGKARANEGHDKERSRKEIKRDRNRDRPRDKDSKDPEKGRDRRKHERDPASGNDRHRDSEKVHSRHGSEWSRVSADHATSSREREKVRAQSPPREHGRQKVTQRLGSGRDRGDENLRIQVDISGRGDSRRLAKRPERENVDEVHHGKVNVGSGRHHIPARREGEAGAESRGDWPASSTSNLHADRERAKQRISVKDRLKF